MTETLLTAVNRALSDMSTIGTALTGLTGNAQQLDVDACVSAINEVVDELLGLGCYPANIGDGTITLVAGTRSYAAATDFVSMADDLMMDTTTGYRIWKYPGGYWNLRRTQLIPANNLGGAIFWAIDPTSGQFYLNMIPTSAEAGRVYHYLYNKETSYSTALASATFPITDEAVRQMIPAVVECTKRRRKGASSFDTKAYQASLARTARILSRQKRRDQYGPGQSPDTNDSLWMWAGEY